MSTITLDESKCVVCNSCIRVCPTKDANVVHINEDGRTVIKVDDSRCIKCGACIEACVHKARAYEDDTEEFFKELDSGRPMALIVAPAIKITFDDSWQNLLAYFRTRGVKMIWDVSFGADICTWAHVRYMEQHPGAKVISQPCPAIVNYILKHDQNVLSHLSPIHSPMMCAAVYMRKYEGFKGTIAAISPCIAKRDEFAMHDHIINYNVTMNHLNAYLKAHGIDYTHTRPAELPFDGPKSYVGAIYPRAGGLKENLQLHLPGVFCYNSEGPAKVYGDIDCYGKASESCLPDVFDVLNCEFGCSGGPGIGREYDMFKRSAIMQKVDRSTNADRLKNMDKKGKDLQFDSFDRQMKVEDFVCRYTPDPKKDYVPSRADLDRAFKLLHKTTEEEKNYNCHACGYETCTDMAAAIAAGINIPENCRQHTYYMMTQEKQKVEDTGNAIVEMAHEIESIINELSGNIETVNREVSEIRANGDESVGNMVSVGDAVDELNRMTAGILDKMGSIDANIENYSKMTASVQAIANKINLLSLNASIESARAGEAGRAFAVVASNIRELSDSSKKSVASAQDNEDSIRASIDAVDSTMEEFTKNFAELTELMKSARGKVEAVSDNSRTIGDSMQQVDEISSRLRGIVEKTSAMLK